MAYTWPGLVETKALGVGAAAVVTLLSDVCIRRNQQKKELVALTSHLSFLSGNARPLPLPLPLPQISFYVLP